MTNALIPYMKLYNPVYQKEIDEIINIVCKTGVYFDGPFVEEFEAVWAQYCGQKYAVSCSSGTDAITLAAKALELTEVNIPSFTIWNTLEGLKSAGVKVNLLEVNKDFSITPKSNQDNVAVPLFGREPTLEERINCNLLDCAQAQGWKPDLHHTCTWSFYPTKTLGCMGDGGMVTTNDVAVYNAVKKWARSDKKYRTSFPFCSRLPEIQAAILCVKLPYLNEEIKIRQQNAQEYKSRLENIKIPNYPKIVFPPNKNYCVYTVMVPHRNMLKNFLEEKGIETKIHYDKDLNFYRSLGSNSELYSTYIANKILSLPFGTQITVSEIDEVCKRIQEFYNLTFHQQKAYAPIRNWEEPAD